MSSMPSAISTATSYWCYSCSRFIRLWAEGEVVCPHCNGGFVEQIELASSEAVNRLRTFSPSSMHMPRHASSLIPRRIRRRTGERPPFNPVVVLRGSADAGPVVGEGERNSYEFFYDNGAGSGLRPVSASTSEFLMGSGFNRLLEQLSQLEINGVGRSANPPASKAAVESMPKVEIIDTHLSSDLRCAVCTDAFELGSEAREMPCNHIYHSECILPWLSMRNSCPVCRRELPADQNSLEIGNPEQGTNEETVGLTIWRLPGGGFAVGRFTGSRTVGGREAPDVFTETEEGLIDSSGATRRISGGRDRRTGFVSAFRSFFSFLGRLTNSSSSSSSSSTAIASHSSSESESGSRTRYSRSNSVFHRVNRRQSRRSWVFDE